MAILHKKVTGWLQLEYPSLSAAELAEHVKNGTLDEVEHDDLESEFDYSTPVDVPVEANDGFSTVEVYDSESSRPAWENGKNRWLESGVKQN